MNTNAITTVTKNANVITLIDVLTVEPAQQQRLVQIVQGLAEMLVQKQGFVSANVHRSLDSTHVVNYAQWENEASFKDVQQSPEFQRVLANCRALARTASSSVYDIVYTDDRSSRGVTTISKEEEVATFINVISTTPERQQALLEFVIGNDNQVFATAPGYRSANFHRGHDGMHVINYSHWDSEQAFLNAINAMFHIPNLTMEQANQMATTQAGGIGQTDFRFYDVVFSSHA